MKKILAAGIVGVLSLIPVVLLSPSAEAQVTDSIVCATSGWDHSDSGADPFNTPVLPEQYSANGLKLGPITAAGKQSGYVELNTPVKLSTVAQNDTGLSFMASNAESALPSYQLRVHTTADVSIWGGHWYSTAGGKWTSSRPNSWPDVPNPATLDEIVAKYPDATISHVGFNLSSAAGEGTLKSLTFQGTRWVFDLCATPPTTTTTTTTTSTTEPTSTTTSESPTSTTTTTSESATSTTTSTTTGESSTTSTTTPVAVVPVGNNTDDLAYTGTPSIGRFLVIAGLLIVAGIAAFVALHLQRRRNVQR